MSLSPVGNGVSYLYKNLSSFLKKTPVQIAIGTIALATIAWVVRDLMSETKPITPDQPKEKNPKVTYHFLGVRHTPEKLPIRPEKLSELGYCQCKGAMWREDIEKQIVTDFYEGTLSLNQAVFLGIGSGLCLQEVIILEKLMQAGATFSKIVLIDHEYKEGGLLYPNYKTMQDQVIAWAKEHQIEAIFYPSISAYAQVLKGGREPKASIAVQIDPAIIDKNFWIPLAESWDHQFYLDPKGVHYVGKFEDDMLGLHRTTMRQIGDYIVINTHYRKFIINREESPQWRHFQVVRKLGADREREIVWYDTDYTGDFAKLNLGYPIDQEITTEMARVIDAKLPNSIYRNGFPAYII